MAYVPDPTDVTQPIGSVKAGTADEEFRAIKLYLQGLVLGAVSQGPTVRQTALIGSQDSSGDPNFLSAGTGLALNLAALDAPLALTYAAGSGAAGDINYSEALGADVPDIVTGLQPGNLSYITKLYGGAWGKILAPCQYGKVFNKTAQLLVRWPGANNAIATTEDFGNTLTFVGNAKLSTGTQILGLNTVALDGTGDYVTTPFAGVGSGSWEFFGSFRTDSLAVVQTVINLGQAASGFGIVLQIDTTGKFLIYLSSNATSHDIVSGGAGATVMTINTTYFYRLTYDALAGTYRIYLSNNGAAEIQDYTLSSALRLCSGTILAIGATQAAANGFNGNIGFTGFRRFASFTSAQATGPTVAPTFADVKTDFFSIPQMKMYEVTAESTVAGVNPAMTAIRKLYLAEALTSAVAVTGVANYAFKRQYVGTPQTIPAGGTPVTITHNLGIPAEFILLSAEIVNTTGEAGYTPGEAINVSSNLDNATNVLTSSRLSKSASINSAAYASIGFGIKSTGVRSALTIAKWKISLSAKSTF